MQSHIKSSAKQGHGRTFALLTATMIRLCAGAACGGSPTGPDALSSTQGLITAIQNQGATVSSAGSMSRDSFPFFSVNADRLLVNGESVHVFDYENAAVANQQAGLVSASGNPIGNTQVSWVDTPHFYKQGHLVVLYVGRSSDITRVLTAVLGSPFAGGA